MGKEETEKDEVEFQISITIMGDKKKILVGLVTDKPIKSFELTPEQALELGRILFEKADSIKYGS